MKDFTYYDRREKHLCYRCSKPLPEGFDKVYCEECNRQHIEYYKAIKEQRRSQGLCINCGKPNADMSRKSCPDCRAKVRKNFEYYISIGICPHCKKEPIYENEKGCLDCVTANTERRKNNRKKNIEKERGRENRYRRQRYQERKEKGLCVRCGRKALEGKVRCGICREKLKKYDKRSLEYPRSMRFELGLCYFCGNELDTDKRICLSCIQRNSSNFPRVRNNANHIWSKNNGLIFGKVGDNGAGTDKISVG